MHTSKLTLAAIMMASSVSQGIISWSLNLRRGVSAEPMAACSLASPSNPELVPDCQSGQLSICCPRW